MNDHSMPDGVHSQLGHCLKAARQARGLTLKQVAERTYILAKLQENDWNVSETARTLDMPRSNLYKKIEHHKISRE